MGMTAEERAALLAGLNKAATGNVGVTGTVDLHNPKNFTIGLSGGVDGTKRGTSYGAKASVSYDNSTKKINLGGTGTVSGTGIKTGTTYSVAPTFNVGIDAASGKATGSGAIAGDIDATASGSGSGDFGIGFQNVGSGNGQLTYDANWEGILKKPDTEDTTTSTGASSYEELGGNINYLKLFKKRK